ncbi:MAG: uroporphyrinogen-III C-methyltransferase [Gemmatimonadaceae bacterium]
MTASWRAGAVYLVGAGPGDPGLLTVRGRELLDACDAIVHDALANPVLLERPTDGPGPELHDVGKRGGKGDSATQDDINALLVRLAGEGKRVVRLKGGDPFVFGRGSEEALALTAAGIAFEVVPGVTAGIAAPAYAGIPVTHRGAATSVTFVTGHEDPAKGEATIDWNALARGGGTIVLYMGVRTLPRIAAQLIAGGRSPDTPAAAVEWGTYPRQRTVAATLATLADRANAAGVTAPVITVIGSVVRLREQIAWFDRRPLFGARILVTRAKAQAASLSAELRGRGAEVIESPATRIVPVNDGALDLAIGNLPRYQWVVFTSQNAVAVFFRSLTAAGRDARALGGARLAVIGSGTAAALANHGLAADVIPSRFVAEGVLDAMGSRSDVHDSRVLYVTAAGSRDVLPTGLRTLGATVDVVVAYRAESTEAEREAVRDVLVRGDVDLVTFASGSAVNAFVAAVGADAARAAPCVSIGPITSDVARAAGLIVAAESREATIPALADAAEVAFDAMQRR